ncbi:hypothetical protein [Enterobacter kobei]|uniref:hypothetical protein n=1 Tax=Enterobacter kobei TaxID=208224 RepID=UPI0032AEDE51
MKYIEEYLSKTLEQNEVKGTHTFSCTIEEIHKNAFYIATCTTELGGQKLQAKIPFSKDLCEAESLPTEDFELTVTV